MSDPRFRQGPRPPPRRRPQRTAPSTPEGEGEGERLQKVLADAGLGSRRDCELAIRDGRVRVNGRPQRELPCLVRPGKDLVEWDGEVVDTSLRRERHDRPYLYLMLNKPKGVISTAKDPEGRPHVVGMVQQAVPRGERVYPVGRLDADSTGLVLLTNDGELAHRLAHPRYGITKEYRVTIQGQLTPQAISELKRGIYLADRGAAPGEGGAKRAHIDDLRVLKSARDRSRGDLSLLSIRLSEGQNREIRRLLARVGVKVRRLERVSLGPLKLGKLERGRFRALGEREVAGLREAVLLGGPPR